MWRDKIIIFMVLHIINKLVMTHLYACRQLHLWQYIEHTAILYNMTTVMPGDHKINVHGTYPALIQVQSTPVTIKCAHTINFDI